MKKFKGSLFWIISHSPYETYGTGRLVKVQMKKPQLTYSILQYIDAAQC